MRRSNGFFSKLTPTRKVVRKSGSKQDLRSSAEKIALQRVLGLTTTNTNGLASSATTGLLAYPAGCVIVLYNLKTNQQIHIPNPDKKTITCLAFSNDGKYLVSGESGQQPSVRVWELSESISQVAELRGHKSGITSVEFSPNQKLLVSIGDQHDMLVNVWNWKLGNTVACNKSGCRVRAVSFSENGNYLVTVGNRHVKFWYLDTEASNKGNVPITPITGRSGILGDQRNNCFSDVMCGRGRSSLYTYCVTKSGLLCMFSEKRILDKWVELKAGCTNCLHVTEKYIFCGCSDGVVRVFEPVNLKFIATLPKPHNLGVNVSDGIVPSDLLKSSSRSCPDLVAITVDEKHWKLSCIYNDHSLYIWDVHDVKKVGKAASFLYHSACIWGVEIYPYFEGHRETLPPGSFLTCSSDDTIRIWNLETGGQVNKAYPRNLYSKELLKVAYIDEGLTNLQDTSMAPFGKESDNKNGVRCMQVSPNGQVLATGDRNGNLRIYDLQFFDELIRIEAHESEILCVEFCLPESGYHLLASSSRDRLIHIFDVKNDYTLLQTIDDHSSSITAVRFNYDLDVLQLLSCGADKVVMFHTAQMNDAGNVSFVRNTIVPGKSTLYDMVIEPTRKYAATVGQDRNLRIYDIQGAKQINSYKGSLGDEGNLIKLQLDQSGMYAAVSCSDKTLAIYDFGNGDCVSAIYGHSELATGLKFTADGKHLISVSGDGCIFVWKLPTSFTENILNRMNDLNLPLPNDTTAADDASETRRKTFVVKSTSQSPISNSINEFRDAKQVLENAPGKSPFGYRFSVGQLPLWAQKQIGVGDNNAGNKGTAQPLGKWGERSESGLCTVPEISQDIRRYSNSQDSSSSLSSEKSTVFEEQNSVEANVIYPAAADDNIIDDLERTFQVTESSIMANRHKTTRPLQPSSCGDVDQNELASRRSNGAGSPFDVDSDFESETQTEGLPSSSDSDDVDTFSPLMEHFEKLATPVADGMLSDSKSEHRNENEGTATIPTHRASISAKFLSRSQRTRSSASTVTAEEQRRRIEALKARINSTSSNHTTNKTNATRPIATRHTASALQHQKSVDSFTPPSSRVQAKEFITTNLKKKKLISKSCQNLSAVQTDGVFDDWQTFQLNNQILTSPSSRDVLYDPRRSSTPLQKHPPSKESKYARRSTSSAWTSRAPVVSPVGSPVNEFQRKIGNKASSPVFNRLDDGESKQTLNNDVITRKSTTTKNRNRRPRSMIIDTKEISQHLLNFEPFQPPFQPPENHSDTDCNVGSQSRDFNDNQTNTSPIRPLARDIDIGECFSTGEYSSSHDNQWEYQERERVSEVASEINNSLTNMTMQVLHPNVENHNGPISEQVEIEAGSSQRLIRLYENGLATNEPTSNDGDDVQNLEKLSEGKDNEEDEEADETPVNISNSPVTWERCQDVMRNLVQSYDAAAHLQNQILNETPTEEHKKLLSTLSRTYAAIENSMHEQRKKLDQIIQMRSDETNSLYIQSDLFKELQKTLTVTTLPGREGVSAEIFTLLDKYSNVLVDMISTKMNGKETLIQ